MADSCQEGGDSGAGREFSSLELFVNIDRRSAVGEYFGCVWRLNNIGDKMFHCSANTQSFNLARQPSHLMLKKLGTENST